MSGSWIRKTVYAPHIIEHMLSEHSYARALRSHFLTAACLTASILDAFSLIDHIDVRCLLMFTVPFSKVHAPSPVAFRKIPLKSQLMLQMLLRKLFLLIGLLENFPSLALRWYKCYERSYITRWGDRAVGTTSCTRSEIWFQFSMKLGILHILQGRIQVLRKRGSNIFDVWLAM